MDRVRANAAEMGRRLGDIVRRCNRFADGPISRKRLVLLCLFGVFLFLYIGPALLRWLFYGDSNPTDPQSLCQLNFLLPFEESKKVYDVYIKKEVIGPQLPQSDYVPYVGNGFFGLILNRNSHLNIKHGRTLSLPVNFYPLYIANESDMNEAIVVEYNNGLVNRYQCTPSGFRVSYQYFAHRTLPALFVQEIKLQNPTDLDRSVRMLTPQVLEWPTAVKHTVSLQHDGDKVDYEVTTGMVEISDSEKVKAVTVVSRKLDRYVKVKSKENIQLDLFTTIQYSEPISKNDYATQKDLVEKRALKAMERALQLTHKKKNLFMLRESHVSIWQQLWFTGFYISDSKAEGALNGDKINATIYSVLSQVRSLENEEDIIGGHNAVRRAEILRTLTYSEGCYEGHSTLEAENLWKPLDSLEQVNSVVGSWILTLEKQGCHNLLKAGASGVNQAMVLSFGSMRFSNQHLEYNIHPSKLHRDFLFRRINYGNMTHVNISVTVQDDNKAALYVALDRSDRTYYACDAGCLDNPVQLGPVRKYFPVKLTEPLTAILYITSDKVHMEDLQHAIHVKEIGLAPAHEHHVIALHKHGQSLGDLNPLFWITICVLIVLFHCFLCRIVMTEYCDNNSYRRLYNKP